MDGWMDGCDAQHPQSRPGCWPATMSCSQKRESSCTRGLCTVLEFVAHSRTHEPKGRKTLHSIVMSSNKKSFKYAVPPWRAPKMLGLRGRARTGTGASSTHARTARQKKLTMVSYTRARTNRPQTKSPQPAAKGYFDGRSLCSWSTQQPVHTPPPPPPQPNGNAPQHKSTACPISGPTVK